MEGPVAALEVEGDGVEAGGDEDAVVAGAPKGSDDSVNKDMLAGPKMYSAGFEAFETATVCLREKIKWMWKCFLMFCVFDSSEAEVDA